MFHSPQVKRGLISSRISFIYELPNGLRPTILGNQEISGKSGNWLDTEPSAQSPLIRLKTLVVATKLYVERGIKVFLVLSNWLSISLICPKTVFRDCQCKQFFLITRSIHLQTSNFNTQIFYNFKVTLKFYANINRASSGKVPNITLLCKYHFACFVFG